MMRLDFEKQNGLIPCIVQDVDTKKVLMLKLKAVQTDMPAHSGKKKQLPVDLTLN